MNSEKNKLTLGAYERHVDEYLERTPETVDQGMKLWLDKFLTKLPENPKVFEVGSGTGRDALYLQKHGAKVTCSDATAGFLNLLQSQGLNPSWFNLLTDDFPEGDFDGVLANAVLLHFSPAEFQFALRKIREAKRKDAWFAFSLKLGDGADWESEKLGEPRYFHYWDAGQVVVELVSAGFAEVIGDPGNEGWLMVLAR
jgi:SAM-dependent methyltransferase